MELALTDEGASADQWEVDSLNALTRASKTNYRRQDLDVWSDRRCITCGLKTRLLNICLIDCCIQTYMSL
jgi:hypothetical protein